MAKGSLTLPNGTVVQIEWTVEEVQAFPAHSGSVERTGSRSIFGIKEPTPSVGIRSQADGMGPRSFVLSHDPSSTVPSRLERMRAEGRGIRRVVPAEPDPVSRAVPIVLWRRATNRTTSISRSRPHACCRFTRCITKSNGSLARAVRQPRRPPPVVSRRHVSQAIFARPLRPLIGRDTPESPP